MGKSAKLRKLFKKKSERQPHRIRQIRINKQKQFQQRKLKGSLREQDEDEDEWEDISNQEQEQMEIQQNKYEQLHIKKKRRSVKKPRMNNAIKAERIQNPLGLKEKSIESLEKQLNSTDVLSRGQKKRLKIKQKFLRHKILEEKILAQKMAQYKGQ